MIDDIVGNNGTRFIIAAGAVALGLLCLVGVLWFIRNRPSSPFIRGGKNRQPRLAVLDAAAIDTRRRLVLVRRDDVEHLIMIGGPTDVVIESRIATQVQTGAPQAIPASTAALPTTAVTERSMSRPAPERRAVPQSETKPAPVSAMGQVLYDDVSTVSPTPVRATQPSQTRAQTDPAPVLRQQDRQVPVQTQPRPQPVVSNIMTPPVSIETVKSPEDILDAARNRVLAVNQQAAIPRPVAQPNPVPATVTAQPILPPTQDRQETGTKEPSALEFERILDAEITGDLGKFTADSGRVGSDQRSTPASPGSLIRQEPRLGGPASQASKAEPSLEEEMNRMLSEIAVNRKN